MTIWDKYTSEQQEVYENYLKMYGALSGMFNQKSSETGAPYLDSKFQETIYSKSFESEDVDIGNTPHDIKSSFGNENVGIGIKTWLNSNPSYQKVMQIKRNQNDINPYIKESTKEELAYQIAKIKNDRLQTDYKRLGLKSDSNIYHYITRDKGLLSLQETSYPLINMNTLKPGKLTDKSFSFSDNEKDYRYTFGDSQIFMRFDKSNSNTHLLKKIKIDIIADPFKFLSDSFKRDKSGIYLPEDNIKTKYLYLPLYSYANRDVPKSSGLNAWNGSPKTSGSTKPRPKGEAYIPIPKELWNKCPNWVDKNIDMRDYKGYKQKTGKSSYPINLHMPDGQIFEAIFSQSNFKSLQTNPQSILGNWILNVLGITNPQREVYNKDASNIVTYELLKKKGFDSVKLWHKDPTNLHEVWIDFAELGSFNEFMEDK